jgi:hypothetical protein
LTKILQNLVSNPGQRAALGAHSAELITQYSVQACAAGIIRAALETARSR